MAQSLRPFVGARDFDRSRAFYAAWGFGESPLGKDMSVLARGNVAFYLQRYYKKEWVDNTMVFYEVDDVAAEHARTLALGLPERFAGVRVSADIRHEDWGAEFFVHDPSGVLWHVGAFGG